MVLTDIRRKKNNRVWAILEQSSAVIEPFPSNRFLKDSVMLGLCKEGEGWGNAPGLNWNSRAAVVGVVTERKQATVSFKNRSCRSSPAILSGLASR